MDKMMGALREVSAMHLVGKASYRMLLGKNKQDFQHSLSVRICPGQTSWQGCGKMTAMGSCFLRTSCHTRGQLEG